MRVRSRLLTLIGITMVSFGNRMPAIEPPCDIKNVREIHNLMLITPDDYWRRDFQYMLYMGEKVFPAYEKIALDSMSRTNGKWMVIDILIYVEADRRCFIKYALPLLKDKNSLTRHTAVGFLEYVGSPAQAPAVVPLLSDGEAHVVMGAARTLAAIGGANELRAMDIWLRGDSHRNDPKSIVRQEVQERRDELKKRLDEDKDPKKRARKIHQCWRNLQITEWEGKFVVQRAVWSLTAFGTETVAFLKDYLPPVPSDKQNRLDQLLADLDSDEFARREGATRELSRGVVAEAILEKELKNRPSLEKKRRLEAILDDFPKWREKNPELLRQFRAVWVLQQIGTPEARALLEKLAAGAPSAALTHKAKDALQSLDRLKKK